jgi:hypothetical protein
MRSAAITVLVSCLASATLLADWVDLKDGTSLRGLDYKPGDAASGKRALFTLETGITVSIPADAISGVRASLPDETVEHDGRQVTLRERIRALKAEAAKRERAAELDLEKWARGEILDPKNAKYRREGEEARARFEALSAKERHRVLVRLVRKSSRRSVRLLAARELAQIRDASSVGALASAVVRDQEKTVREAALVSLKSLADPATGDHLSPYLLSPARPERVRASQALETFPTRRAVPVLIESLRKTWSDFGRAFVFQGTQRSYIKDYNLVSGGTGFSIIEVADPEIATVTDGVVLDVKVRKIEQETYVRTLRAITGQYIGNDPVAWAEWWRTTGKDEKPAEPAKP